MPNVSTATLLARIQNLENQNNLNGNPQSFFPSLNSNFNSTSTLPTATTTWTAGNGGKPYAVYNYTQDGCVHLSVCVNINSSGLTGGTWYSMLSSNLPVAPVTNKYFPIVVDVQASQSGEENWNATGAGGMLDASGDLHVVGFSSAAKIVAFNAAIPLAW
jgi:hypothetical protein